MNYSEIKYCDIANGIGARTSLFVSGCRHHCKGCFNEVAWDFSHGKAFTDSVEDDIIKSLMVNLLSGFDITFAKSCTVLSPRVISAIFSPGLILF